MPHPRVREIVQPLDYHAAPVVIFSGIQPTGSKHLGNYIGAILNYVAGQDRADPAIYCIVDLHAVTVPYDPAGLRERVYDTTAILMAAGLDPERCILFRQGDVEEHTELAWLLSASRRSASSTACTSSATSRSRSASWSSAGLLYYPVLMAADVLAYRAHEVPVGEDQREHLELMRDIAERFNTRFGELLVVPEARIPEVGARVRDLQEPERKMSTTGASEQGTVYVLDEPDVDPAQVPARGRRLGPRDRPPRGQARDLEPDRDHGRRSRDAGRKRSSASSTAPATATSRPRWRTRWSTGWARCASATRSCAAMRPSSSGTSRRAPTRRARSRPARSPTCARRWASARRVAPSPGRLACRGRMATIVHRLELDLDVFAGPFDLLLSLVLREELDLLEVELAEVVLAYVDHLEAEGELDLEAATEFLVLIAALLELKSRLMLPGEELPDDLEGLGPAEAAEELLERMLQYARFRGAGGWVAEAHAAGRAYLHRSAPLPPALRQVSAELAERVYDPAVLGRRSARCCARRRRSTCGTWRGRACPWGTGWRCCGGCWAAGGSRSTRRSRAPTA